MNHKEELNNLKKIESEILLGGGIESHKKQKAKGKFSARERIEKLIDKNSKFLEIGLFSAYKMYEEFGGAPSAGVVVGIGKIEKRDCVIVSNDATVKAGAWFPMTCKKILRAQEISIENNIPIIYLVDSAGVFLPLQSEIFPDKEHFGRIFFNNSIMSSKGITQIAAIMGPCVAGGAYLPVLSDESIIVDGTGSVFLAGSHLVKAAIGEEIENEKLGGATVHSEISGVTDYKAKDDFEAIKIIRSIVNKIGEPTLAGFNKIKSVKPKFQIDEILNILPTENQKQYSMKKIIDCIVDENSFDEYKSGYGKTLICGYARVNGWSVGIVANERMISKTKTGELQIGGVIYSDSADKATRFILNCNQKKIPLIFFQDVTGFMVGSRAEHGGIIKDGAKMVNAVSNSIVPKFTFIVGNSFGAGNYAMCGKAFSPRLIFAWHTAKIAVMGAKQASETLQSIRIQSMKKSGKEIDNIEQNKIYEEIFNRYENESSPLFAASKLWVDGIINPIETREIISRGIEIANCNNKFEKFSTGVIQT